MHVTRLSHGQRSLLAILFLVLPTSLATAGPPLKALVTNRAELSLPTTIEMPQVVAVSDAADFTVMAGGNTALFVRRAGASRPVRVIQTGDAAPGVPHSRVEFVSSARANASRLMALVVDYLAVGWSSSGLYVYDGSSFVKIALSSDRPPGASGVYGRSISLIGINASGAVAFSAPLIPLGSPSGTTLNTTVYSAPSGGAPARVAGIGDPAPGTGGGTIGAISTLGFNDLGEVF